MGPGAWVSGWLSPGPGGPLTHSRNFPLAHPLCLVGIQGLFRFPTPPPSSFYSSCLFCLVDTHLRAQSMRTYQNLKYRILGVEKRRGAFKKKNLQTMKVKFREKGDMSKVSQTRLRLTRMKFCSHCTHFPSLRTEKHTKDIQRCKQGLSHPRKETAESQKSL